MRLDKYISGQGLASRRACAEAVRRGQVLVNGLPAARADMQIDPDKDSVCFCGTDISYTEHVYFMLNKPAGYVSATDDRRLPAVTDLFPEQLRRRGIFPCGRLDRDTTGLMLITDDGPLSHALLTPRRHVEKVYRFVSATPLAKQAEDLFSSGMVLASGEQCKPATLRCAPDRLSGEVTLTEGKYHQIKRMVAAAGGSVVQLERICFAGIPLDAGLERGCYRALTADEILKLKENAYPKTEETSWTFSSNSHRS